jgi:hypothetical protein
MAAGVASCLLLAGCIGRAKQQVLLAEMIPLPNLREWQGSGVLGLKEEP